MDQQILEVLKWLSVGVAWPVSTYITYRIGRKSKNDDIQIKKRYDFSEQIAELLQRDHNHRESLTSQYHSNFGHINSFSEAMHSFHKHEYLYTGLRELINDLPAGIGEIVALSRRAAIYIDEKTLLAIEQYIAATTFSYHSDSLGLINTYAEDFFKSLLDERRSAQSQIAYKKAMRGLRNAVR